jgi:predicted NAD/FAD-dependent oxidoreductase
MDEDSYLTIVIGAGMAGLACATRLAANGDKVIVFDKGRGPGGRMATRRVEIAGEQVTFDHGAQYFTARDPAFRAAVAKWERDGVVARWPAAGEDAWVGVPGMNAPLKAMAEGLDVRWNTRVHAVSFERNRWQVDTPEGRFTAVALFIAVPAEQAFELVRGIAPVYAAKIAKVTSDPCWAVMAAFDAPLEIASDVVRAPGADISWAARNSAKPGRSGTECWVIHASPERSRVIIDSPADEAAALLLDDFFRQTGTTPRAPIHLAAHRWLYALPRVQRGAPFLYDFDVLLGIVGDYQHSPRVEGAWLSGHLLAAQFD